MVQNILFSIFTVIFSLPIFCSHTDAVCGHGGEQIGDSPLFSRVLLSDETLREMSMDFSQSERDELYHWLLWYSKLSEGEKANVSYRPYGLGTYTARDASAWKEKFPAEAVSLISKHHTDSTAWWDMAVSLPEYDGRMSQYSLLKWFEGLGKEGEPERLSYRPDLFFSDRHYEDREIQAKLAEVDWGIQTVVATHVKRPELWWDQLFYRLEEGSPQAKQDGERDLAWLSWYAQLEEEVQEKVDERTHFFFAQTEFSQAGRWD